MVIIHNHLFIGHSFLFLLLFNERTYLFESLVALLGSLSFHLLSNFDKPFLDRNRTWELSHCTFQLLLLVIAPSGNFSWSSLNVCICLLLLILLLTSLFCLLSSLLLRGCWLLGACSLICLLLLLLLLSESGRLNNFASHRVGLLGKLLCLCNNLLLSLSSHKISDDLPSIRYCPWVLYDCLAQSW